MNLPAKFCISSEDDIRLAVRVYIPRPMWIEPALGSTNGLPDFFWFPSVGRLVFGECKMVAGGLVHFTPAQQRVFPRMVADGAEIGLVLGVRGTGQVFWADLGVLDGWSRLRPGWAGKSVPLGGMNSVGVKAEQNRM